MFGNAKGARTSIFARVNRKNLGIRFIRPPKDSFRRKNASARRDTTRNRLIALDLTVGVRLRALSRSKLVSMSAKEQANAENYQTFERLLPSLLKKEEGRFALLHGGKLIGVFDTAAAAHAHGAQVFDDGLFSVQKVKSGTIGLGFFSYARYCRAT